MTNRPTLLSLVPVTVALAALTGCAVPQHSAERAHPGVASLPAPVAGPSDVSLFGLVMRKPFGGFPECALEPAQKYEQTKLTPSPWKYRTFNDPNKGPCYKRLDSPKIGTGAPLSHEVLWLEWPYSRAPKIAQGNVAIVGVLNGVVHSISVPTKGVNTQNADFAELTGKFGKPSASFSEKSQNRLGAQFSVINASWRFPNQVGLFFAGALDKTTTGRVWATTPEWDAYEKSQRNALNANRQRL